MYYYHSNVGYVRLTLALWNSSDFIISFSIWIWSARKCNVFLLFFSIETCWFFASFSQMSRQWWCLDWRLIVYYLDLNEVERSFGNVNFSALAVRIKWRKWIPCASMHLALIDQRRFVELKRNRNLKILNNVSGMDCVV